MKTIRIGLLLGVEISMPLALESLIDALRLNIRHKGETYSFSTERILIEPFNIRQEPAYDIVIDRVSHWSENPREWLKKISYDGVYLLNNPFTFQSAKKHTGFCAMAKLGLNIPETWLLPQRDMTDLPRQVIGAYSRTFDLKAIGEKIGYPLYMKPYDGGGWVGVKKIDNHAQLRAAYDESGTRMMHLQKSIEYQKFCRSMCIGPQILPIRYNPKAPLHERYEIDFEFLSPKEGWWVTSMAKLIDAFFGWDYNSSEALIQGQEIFPIDFANAVPDSSVCSLHFYFPIVLKNLVRWLIFCGVTRRRFSFDLNRWGYLDISEMDISFEDKMKKYMKLAEKYFEEDKFRDFCERRLGHLDEAAYEFFSSKRMKEIIDLEVGKRFPRPERERFSEHYKGLIEFWLKCESDRLSMGGLPR